MIAEEPVRTPKLFDERDVPWIRKLVDVAEQSVGQPWRVLAERIEHAPLTVHAASRAAVLGALRRVTSGGSRRTRIARKVRALVLGPPVLDAAARATRLAEAAAQLSVAPHEVDALLWIDLAMERPVTLPSGRPSELELAGFANLERIQRSVRRAQDLELRVWDDANALVRQIARSGLLAQIRRDGECTVLDVMGPLRLCHTTTVYGRTLARLIPSLVEHDRFELAMRCQIGGHEVVFRIAPPLLLPRSVVDRPPRSGLAERLARELRERGYGVEREPAPIAHGDRLLFPELTIQHAGAHWDLEILGFTTAAYVSGKLDAYRAAGHADVILCVDARRCGDATFGDPRVVPFGGSAERGRAKPIDANAIAAIMTAQARAIDRPP